ncbi:hypothetical protein N836_35855 [Leptolyngbya sp. Heron Island J]|uniref:hypothetical protein n=1 Tax=Leptolyngbya sp. Heron Island J TaxID=1385935 RepID=UPI0003B97313|nr:hypothetical protein [Leptolyngbya sp. Heron Island J]ESA37750.1 hypothetical protein N836_35855 [Leptolyngbya sp. Heron Island J]
MTPDSLLDTAYRFFGDAAVSAMVTFLITRFLTTRSGAIAKSFINAIKDGKVTEAELAEFKQVLADD